MTDPDPAGMVGAYLTDDITWTISGGHDERGEPRTPARVRIRARVKHVSKLIRNFKGEDVVSSAEVLVQQRPGHGDTLSIDGIDRPVAEIREMRTWGTPYYKVYTA